MQTLKVRVLREGHDPVLNSMVIYDEKNTPVPVRWTRETKMLVQNPADKNQTWVDIVLDNVKFDMHHDGGFGQPDIKTIAAALAAGSISISAHDEKTGELLKTLLVTGITLITMPRLAYEILLEKPFRTQPLPCPEQNENETALELMLAAASRAYRAKRAPAAQFSEYAAAWLDWRGVTAASTCGIRQPQKSVYTCVQHDDTTWKTLEVHILTDCTIAEFASDVLKTHPNGSLTVEGLFGAQLANMKFRNGAVFAGFNPAMPRQAIDKNTLAVLDTTLEAGTKLVMCHAGDSGYEYTVKISIPDDFDARHL